MSDKINLNELSQKDINYFARRLYKLNRVIWDAIMQAEELTHLHFINDFNEFEHEEYMEKLAKAYKKVNSKENDEFAQVETNSCYFQEFDYFTQKLQEVIDTLDKD